MSSALLEISNLSKTFAQPILKNLYLEIQPGTIHGLVGQNGAGKSTFLKLLTGEIEPTEGKARQGSVVR